MCLQVPPVTTGASAIAQVVVRSSTQLLVSAAIKSLVNQESMHLHMGGASLAPAPHFCKGSAFDSASDVVCVCA